MAIFGKLNALDLEISNKEQFALIVDYFTALHKEYSKSDSFHLEVGEHQKLQLNGDTFAIEQVYETKEITECVFEAHKKYIDVHYILDGTEKIAVANTGSLTIDKEYDSQDDYALYKQPFQSSSLILESGDIAIFFPNDAHMTSITTTNKSIVIKSVVKIPVKTWELKGDAI